MARPVMSGADVVAALKRLGFEVVGIRGSHAKLRRQRAGGARETLTISLHSPVGTGTLAAIRRQAARYLTREEIAAVFGGGGRA